MLLLPFAAFTATRTLKQTVLWTDDIPVMFFDRNGKPVQTKKGESSLRRSRFWPCTARGDAPYTVFDFTISRDRDGPMSMLTGTEFNALGMSRPVFLECVQVLMRNRLHSELKHGTPNARSKGIRRIDGFHPGSISPGRKSRRGRKGSGCQVFQPNDYILQLVNYVKNIASGPGHAIPLQSSKRRRLLCCSRKELCPAGEIDSCWQTPALTPDGSCIANPPLDFFTRQILCRRPRGRSDSRLNNVASGSAQKHLI